MLQRTIDLTQFSEENFFLWGPRKTGKSTLIKKHFSGNHVLYLDLLKSDVFTRYMKAPWLLREEIEGDPNITRVVIDEVQKIPNLLDEIHWLIENSSAVFCLCGSSARKLKRGKANLLGGRALKAELFGLTSSELAEQFDLNHMLLHGYLPQHYLGTQPQKRLRAYVSDYLKEEIAAEGLVRNLATFSNFLTQAAFSDGSLVNFSNIARDTGVSSQTVKEYFTILEDTLLGRWVPAYVARAKRRVKRSPKFFFFDCGVVNQLLGVTSLVEKSDHFGKVFENFICHELHAYASYSGTDFAVSYWQTAGGTEVDFILGDMEVAIEVKASQNVRAQHFKGLRTLSDEHTPKKKILLCREPRKRKTSDGLFLYPYKIFLEELWSGGIIR